MNAEALGSTLVVVNSWMLRAWDPQWLMSWALGRQDKEEDEEAAGVVASWGW